MSVASNVIAWLLLFLSFSLVLLMADFRRDGKLLLTFWGALLVRQLLALRFSYFSGLAFDAAAFHEMGTELISTPWKLGVGEQFYGPLLGALYGLLGASELLGIQLTIIAFALSSMLFVRLIRLFDLYDYRLSLFALFALLPSSIMFTSTTMREGFQMCGFLALTYFGLRYRRDGDPANIALCAAGAALLGFLHNGLIALAPMLVVLILVWRVHRHRLHWGYFSPRALMFAACLVVGVAGGLLGVAKFRSRINGASALQALFSSQALAAARQYREGGMEIEARATYGVSLEIDSPQALAKSSSLIMVYYMFAPFPWQVQTPVDLYGFAEAVMRMLLIAAALKTWLKLRGTPRRIATLLLGMYAMAVAMWAIGTVNYGTALRHHYTTTWILFLLGWPQLVHWFREFIRRLEPLPVRVAATR